MTVNDGTAPLTVGNVTWWPNGNYPVTGNTDPVASGVYTQSRYCYQNMHVWACDHAEKCKCGKVTRQIEPKKCQVCGKASQ